MRAPRECLRFKLGPITRDREVSVDRPLGSSRPHKYTRASEPTSSRLPTIHLSKNIQQSLPSPLRLDTVIFPSLRFSSSLSRRSGEADISVAFFAVNRCREEFFSPSRPGRPLRNPCQDDSYRPTPCRNLSGDKITGRLSLTTKTGRRFARRSVFQSVAAIATSASGRLVRRSSSTATRP